jgi:hypothetical protein
MTMSLEKVQENLERIQAMRPSVYKQEGQARMREYQKRFAHGTGARQIGWTYRQQIADIRKNARTKTNSPVKFHQLDLRWSERGRVWDSREGGK